MYNCLFTKLSIRRSHFRCKIVSLAWLNGWNTTRKGYYPPKSTIYPKLSLSGSACAPANGVSVYLGPWIVEVLLTLCTPYSSSGSTVNALYTPYSSIGSTFNALCTPYCTLVAEVQLMLCTS